jgi:hypothetical protein
VVDGSEFCVHHTRLLASVDPDTAEGRTPKRRSRSKQVLRVLPEATVDPVVRR